MVTNIGTGAIIRTGLPRKLSGRRRSVPEPARAAPARPEGGPGMVGMQVEGALDVLGQRGVMPASLGFARSNASIARMRVHELGVLLASIIG
jgi:hypothetical protein